MPPEPGSEDEFQAPAKQDDKPHDKKQLSVPTKAAATHASASTSSASDDGSDSPGFPEPEPRDYKKYRRNTDTDTFETADSSGPSKSEADRMNAWYKKLLPRPAHKRLRQEQKKSSFLCN